MSDTDTTADAVSAVKKPKPGTFSSTHQPKHRRTADRIPHNVKADVVAGLAAHGEDGKGKGGFRGFVKYLAARHPKQAARLVERLLPPSVVVANTGSKASIHTVNVLSVPSGTFLSHEDIVKLQSTRRLEHAPPQQLEQLEPLECLEEPIIEQSERDDQEFTPRTEAERELRAQLESLSEEQLREIAKQVGCDVDS